MKDDPIDDFLAHQASLGTPTSEGVFTLETRKALEKLSAHQLPFAGCWALKLVQAAVASGCCSAIRVASFGQRLEFNLEGSFDWSGSIVQSAILNPSHPSSASMQHLTTGLRVLSFHDAKSWSLTLGESGDVVAWTGKEFTRAEQQPGEGIRLRIVSEDPRKLGKIVASVLAARAHVCPVPLSFENNRLDALELNPRNGFGPKSQPLAIGYQNGGLPRFPLPQATGSTSVRPATVKSSLSAATRHNRNRKAPADGRCSLAFLLSVHIKPESSVLVENWEYKSSKSRRYWVLDGVIISEEKFGKLELLCSVGCFLSAENMTLDASGFALRDQAEKRRRVFKSRELLREGLKNLGHIDYETLISTEKTLTRQRVSLLLLGGLATLPLSTAIGGFIMVFGAASLALGTAGQTKSWQQLFQEALAQLRKSL